MPQNIIRLDPQRSSRRSCADAAGPGPTAGPVENCLAVLPSERASPESAGLYQTRTPGFPLPARRSHTWILSVIDELEAYCDINGLHVTSVSIRYLKADLAAEINGKVG